jgi:signal transduction histidine kinase
LTLLQHDLASVLGLQHQLRLAQQQSFRSVGSFLERKEGDGEKAGDEKQVLSINKKKIEEWVILSDQVFQNAESAVGVLSDLLNYDKIQMGTLTLELSLVNIWNSIEKTFNEFNLAAKENHVNLSLDISPLLTVDVNNSMHERRDRLQKSLQQGKEVEWSDVPVELRFSQVVADNVRLAQVFRNLISNGLKFSKENGECRNSLPGCCLSPINASGHECNFSTLLNFSLFKAT